MEGSIFPCNREEDFGAQLLRSTPREQLGRLFSVIPTADSSRNLRNILERRASELGLDTDTYLLCRERVKELIQVRSAMQDVYVRLARCIEDDRRHIPVLPVPLSSFRTVAEVKTVSRKARRLVPRKYLPFPGWETYEFEEIEENEVIDLSLAGIVDPLYRVAADFIPALAEDDLLLEVDVRLGKHVLIDFREANYFRDKFPQFGEKHTFWEAPFLCASVTGLR